MPEERSEATDWKTLHERLEAAALATQRTTEISPERAETLLRERAVTLAVVPSPDEPSDGEKVVQFSLGSEHYAIEARYVKQIVRLTTLSRIPQSPPHLAGLTCIHGELLPVFDVRVLLGIPVRDVTDASRLLILGRGASELGILADEADEISTIKRESLRSPPAFVAEGTKRYLLGIAEGPLFVLDGSFLLADPHLFIDQGEE